MKVFSLFSGVGGFDLAMQSLGHTVIGACEIDRYARQVYQRHFPDTRIYDDARTLQPSELPDFDILCAGFPCQAFSIAGKRRGFDDTRGTLFFEIARITKEKRPPYLLLENVRGLLNHKKGETIRTILSTLDEMGYDAEWHCINSKYSVPQNRDRIFIVGHIRGKSSRKIFPLGGLCKENDSTKPKIVGNVCEHDQTSQSGIVYDSEKIFPALVSGSHGYAAGYITDPKLKQIGNIDTKGHNSLWGRVYDPSGIAPTLNANGGGMGAKTGLIGVLNDRGTLREIDIATCIDANYWKGADNHAQRTMVYFSQKNANMKQRVQDRDNTWTLTNNGGDFGLIDKMRIRKLTPTECERLQAFPDNWTKFGKNDITISDTQRYKMMGNAVTTSVVKYIAKEFGEI